MLAARFDTGAELGGGWWRTLRRRSGTSPVVDLAMAEPIEIRVWGHEGAVDDRNRPLAPRLVVPGVVSTDRLSATLRLSAEQVTALGVGDWEFAIVVGDQTSGEPEVLSRGYFHVSGSVNDL